MATSNAAGRHPALRDETDDAGELIARLLPWGMSFLLHAGLVLLSVFLAWTVTSAINTDDAPIIPAIFPGTTPGQPLSMSESDQASSDYSHERPSAASTATMAPTLFSRERGPGGNRGTGPGSGPGGVDHGDGWTSSNGLGDGLGPGTGSGKANPFASETNGASRGFRATFTGNSGNGRKIIYLVDASGSLIDSFPLVLRGLQRSIGELSDKQSFTVIFFQGGDAIEAPPLGLKRATPEAKQAAIQWVDPGAGNIIPMYQSNPIKALRRALAYKPDLLFLLSDNITGSGVNEVDQRQLLADIDDANQSRTKINTIQFLYRDKLTAVGLRGTLELIADRTGGVYTFLDGKKLGIQ